MIKKRSVTMAKIDKNRIVRNMVDDSKFKTETERLAGVASDIAIAVRDWSLGDYIDDVLSIPKKYFDRRSSVAIINVPGNISYRARYFTFRKDKGRQVCPFGTLAYRDLPKNLKTDIQALIKDEDKNDKLIEKLKEDIRSVVFSVNSIKQLLEIMPETEKYFPQNLKDKMEPKQALVVTQKVKTRILNKMRGDENE